MDKNMTYKITLKCKFKKLYFISINIRSFNFVILRIPVQVESQTLQFNFLNPK